MSAKLRVALFAPYLPAPVFSGGRIRIQHFARALARFCDLDLFAPARAREVSEPGAREALEIYTRVHAISAGPTLPPALNVGRAHRVRRGSPDPLCRRFAADHLRAPYDLAVVEHSHAAAAVMQSGVRVPWILDEHNIESQYLKAKLQVGKALRFWHRPELRRLRAWETACWQHATEVVAVTPDDAARIGEHRKRPAVHIPNGVNVAELVFTPPAERRSANVLFVGLMDHPPNVQAARLLVEQIMPRIWAQRPDAQLVLCGANPARTVRAMAGPRVLVTGRVPSLAPFLADARVFANCLEFGAGSSLKVLEALAVGLPLVSTRVGVRGFALEPEQHYLAAENPDEFAAASLRCLDDRASGSEAALARAQAGRAFAEAHSWQGLAERFAALAQQAAQKRG